MQIEGYAVTKLPFPVFQVVEHSGAALLVSPLAEGEVAEPERTIHVEGWKEDAAIIATDADGWGLSCYIVAARYGWSKDGARVKRYEDGAKGWLHLLVVEENDGEIVPHLIVFKGMAAKEMRDRLDTYENMDKEGRYYLLSVQPEVMVDSYKGKKYARRMIRVVGKKDGPRLTVGVVESHLSTFRDFYK